MFKLLKIVPFLPSLAYASASEHAPAGFNWWKLGSDYANTPAFGWYTITFFMFMGLLVYAAKKPLGEFLKLRSEKIRSEIEEAKRARQEAERRLEQYRSRLENLDKEIADLKADFEAQGEREKKRIMQDAETIAERIKADAQATMSTDLRHAEMRLKNLLLSWTISNVKEMLAGKDMEQFDSRQVSRLTEHIQ